MKTNGYGYRYYCFDCDQDKLGSCVFICGMLGHLIVRYKLERVLLRKNKIIGIRV